MRILFDQAVYDMRNKGNIALLQAAFGRIKQMWPEAVLGVLTLSPHLLEIYCPGAIPVRPDECGTSADGIARFNLLHRLIPRPIWMFLFELREAVWRRKSSAQDVMSKNVGESHTGAEDHIPCDEIEDNLTGAVNGPDQYAALVANADLFIATGAQYMSDACKNDALQVLDRFEAAIRQNIPTAMVGQGLGPINDPVLLARSKMILPKIDLIFVRDRVASYPFLTDLGVNPDKIVLTGDDAVEMAYAARTQSIGKDIGVGLRAAHYTELNNSHIGVLRTVLQNSAKKYDSRLSSIPISFSSHELDNVVIRQLLAGYPKVFDDWRRFSSPIDIIKQISTCRLVVAGTFHAVLFALSQGIPAIGLAKSAMYTDKFLGLIDLFGSGCQVVSLDDKNLAENLSCAIDTAWDSYHTTHPLLLKAAEKQIAWGKAGYQRILELVESRRSAN